MKLPGVNRCSFAMWLLSLVAYAMTITGVCRYYDISRSISMLACFVGGAVIGCVWQTTWPIWKDAV